MVIKSIARLVFNKYGQRLTERVVPKPLRKTPGLSAVMLQLVILLLRRHPVIFVILVVGGLVGKFGLKRKAK